MKNQVSNEQKAIFSKAYDSPDNGILESDGEGIHIQLPSGGRLSFPHEVFADMFKKPQFFNAVIDLMKADENVGKTATCWGRFFLELQRFEQSNLIK